jgi:hypothetical protein
MFARSDFARLVRSLISESNDQIVELQMRGGEGSELPGFDGRVVAGKGTPFVPDGRSVWELGTGEDPAAKAGEDYRTRSDEPLGEVQADTTFVFVTPRRWPEKDDWISRRQKDSPWKAIRVFDVDDIETAFGQAPGAHYTFSETIGKAAHGVQGLERWWSDFASSTNPNLTPELVLAGRQSEAQELLRILDGDATRTVIAAASREDVFAFIAASVSAADESLRLHLFGRALIVKDAAALRSLDHATKLLILLPYDDVLQREAEAMRSHHIVFVTLHDMPANIKLGGVHIGQFTALLEGASVPNDRANSLALTASRSLVAFQRQASAVGITPRPQWRDWLHTVMYLRAWLAGGWAELKSGDVAVMDALLGQSLESALPHLREAAGGEDPIFAEVGNIWRVISPEATWDYAKPQLTLADLKALEHAMQEVLGAVDPKLELPVEQRWAAAIYGKSRVHSESLRTGIATTLALLGAYGDEVVGGGGITARAWTEVVVHQLLGRANRDQSGDLWTSLGDVLPLLAEAAPAQFLTAVDRGSHGAEPVLAKLFTDTDTGFSITSGHPPLLWALESLAWSPDHFALTMEMLAHLTELDPGGRLVNRPKASYISVLMPTFPQTSATPNARLDVLDSLRERHPAIAWNILLHLLPAFLGGGSFNHEPRFRAWKTWKTMAPQPPPQDVWQMIKGIFEDLISIVDLSPEHWPEIIERIPDLPTESRKELYRKLGQLGDEPHA